MLWKNNIFVRFTINFDSNNIFYEIVSLHKKYKNKKDIYI